MHLESLALIQFKNYPEAHLNFSNKINCFAGNNGTGKTNLLDAIYYLSFCKSFTNSADTQNILFDKEVFIIQGKYTKEEKSDELYCAVKKGQKKTFKKNKKEYERLSDHIGSYPLVLIYPGDVQLIHGGSDERRKFLDGVISQNHRDYLQNLMDYNKVLLQRNTLLKNFAERNYFDKASLEIWDEQLHIKGSYIHQKRRAFFEDFEPVFQENHKTLTGNAETVKISYESQLDKQNLKSILQQNINKDRALQYTSAGIHKDNLVFLLGDQPLKKFGSQGQQKSYVIALKLAQYQFTQTLKGFNPILLFDDIFDKLDPSRVELLIKLVSQDTFGQVFITDTHTSRLEQILRSINAPCRIFDVIHGEISQQRDMHTQTNPT